MADDDASWIDELYAQASDDSREPERTSEGDVVLYRPVGQKELDMIAASGYRAFPPRLAQQPIFYPVLNAGYARQIARDWNTRDEASGFAGYVTRFVVRREFIEGYEVQRVGGREHLEYWIPADELDTFNRNMVGEIAVIESFDRAAGRQ